MDYVQSPGNNPENNKLHSFIHKMFLKHSASNAEYRLSLKLKEAKKVSVRATAAPVE